MRTEVVIAKQVNMAPRLKEVAASKAAISQRDSKLAASLLHTDLVQREQ